MRDWIASWIIAYGWKVRYRHLTPNAVLPYPPPAELQFAWSMWLVRTGWALRHGTLLKDWSIWWLRRGVWLYRWAIGHRVTALKAAIRRGLLG